MTRYLLLAVVAVVLLADGVLCGRWSNFWRQDEELTRAAAKVSRLPAEFGGWKAEEAEAQPLDAKVVRIAGFSGYASRRYRKADAAVSVLLACGRPGPLSVHTPEVCYAGAGYQMAEAPTRYSPELPKNAGHAEFFDARFARANTPERLRVLWSWNKQGVWQVSDSPRWAFAGAPVLYKLYVSESYYPGKEGTDATACLEFLRDFLPALDETLGKNP